MALALAGVGVPALGQQQKKQQQQAPESLLPPGFDQPAPASAPAPAAAPARPAAEPQAAPTLTAEPLDGPPPVQTSDDDGTEEVDGNSTAPVAPVDLSQYDLPALARHPLNRVGIFAWGNTAFPAGAFGTTRGSVLETLMQRLDAPVASRWVSIVLRRALMSPVRTPADTNGANFAAERADLLARMGEANAARAVLNYVDTADYTPRLMQAALQVAMATGDPAQLCPAAERGMVTSGERSWGLVQAMCAALAGKPSQADQLLQAARRGTSQGDVDVLLAEKVVGMGIDGRRAVTIDWVGVPDLTAWRFGLATATGVTIPDELYANAGPAFRYWQALSPGIAPAARIAPAELAATAGVFSNAGLVDLYAEADQAGDAPGPVASAARDLRAAYTGAGPAERIAAIKALWDAADTPRTRYARLILTAKAAAWIPASKDAAEPDRLVASMLSAGYDRAAMEWRSVVTAGGEGWALLALADPMGRPVAYADFERFTGSASPRKAQMLLAGMAGLGLLNAQDAARGAEATQVRVGGENSWTRAIDAAARRNEPGTVALLAAVGMQSTSWDRVTPEALFHIVAAMRATGMVDYARMIAVEAVTRTA